MESSDDSYDMIPKRPKEFLKLIQQPDAARVLQDVGVDVVSWFLQSILGGETTDPPRIDGPPRQVGLFDFVSVIFPTLDAKLTFQDLMQVPFTCVFTTRVSSRVSRRKRRVRFNLFPYDGYCMFSLMFFLFLIFGMGQIGRSEKYPLNVMKRCVFSKKWQPKCAPAVFDGDHFTQVFAYQRCGS